MTNTHYRIGVITNSDGPSMQDLRRMATKFGVTFSNVSFSYLPLTGLRKSELMKEISSYDVIYYRTGMRDTALQELSYILKKKGIPIINACSKHPGLHLKIQQALIADRYGIKQPKSIYTGDFDYNKVSSVLGPSFVVKPDFGSKGNEVTLVSSADELAALETNRTKSFYMYQELITDAEEYRVYAIGGRGVVSYKKIPGDGDFRANLHAGGSMQATEPDREQQLLEFGGHVAGCFGADIAGVDILYKNGEPIFIELNWQPGWENLDELTGESFSKLTVQFILEKAAQHYSIH